MKQSEILGVLSIAVAAGFALGGCEGRVADPECRDSNGCDEGRVCVSQACAACAEDEDCHGDARYGTDSICQRGACSSPGDCERGTLACPCLADDSCADDSDCVDEVCVEACPDGQIRDGSECRAAEYCEVCEHQDRHCTDPGDEDTAPECGDCLDGFQDEDGTCAAVANCNIGEAGSIVSECEALQRLCVSAEEGASCGECIAEYVEVEGSCVPMVTCSVLECGAENRGCSETPNGHCMGCLSGFTEDGEACRGVLTCQSHPCADGQTCVEAGEHVDRTCADGGDCPEWSVPHRDGTYCVPCAQPCTAVAGSSGNMVPEAFGGIECVCETAPGYFLSPGSGGGGTTIVACDADGDGWVRDTILGLEDYATSEIIRENNRCSVRFIKGVLFRDEAGQLVGKELMPEAVSIPLLESTRNDSDEELALLQNRPEDRDYLPAVGGRFLVANELNGLGRVCASKRADFNHNGVPDVQERHEDDTTEYVSLLEAKSRYASGLKDFTYYTELHHGWFEAVPNEVCAWETQIGGELACGQYVIQERSRAKDAEAGVGLTYYQSPEEEVETNSDGGVGNDHWRTCGRFTDHLYEERQVDAGAQYGLDFARLGLPEAQVGIETHAYPPSLSLGHHSQFKCIVFDTTPEAGEDFVYGATDLSGYALNACAAAADSIGPGDVANPTKPVFTCQRSVDAAEEGWVGWGAAIYQDEGVDGYTRGCVDEFRRYRPRCPGYVAGDDITNAKITGDSDAGNYGNLLCGCAAPYGGAACEIGCPDTHRFIHPDFADTMFPASARKEWMCSGFAAQGYVGTPYLSGGAYRLYGGFSLQGGHSGGTPMREQNWTLWGGFPPAP